MLRIVTIFALVSAFIAASADAQLPADSLRAKLYRPTGYRSVLLVAPVPSPREGNDLRLTPLLGERILLNAWQAPISSGRRKSPGLAWFLSFLVPGGGQGYNGQWGKAAMFFGVAFVGFNMTVHNGGPICNYLPNDDCGRANTGLAILAVSSIASQIDAPITAVAINRRNRNPAPRASLSLITLHF